MRNDIIDPDSSHGFKNEKFFSIAILILIIVAIGGFAILRSDAEINLDFLRGEVDQGIEESEENEEDIELDEENEDSETENSEENEGSEEDEVGLAQYEEGDNEGATYEEVESEDNEYDGQSYSVEAESGDGLTHVARKAAEAHIDSKGDDEDLTAEHKVYIEDYIQKNLDHDTGWLQAGETVEVPEGLIDEAIEEANQLNEDQLENLSQYTVST